MGPCPAPKVRSFSTCCLLTTISGHRGCSEIHSRQVSEDKCYGHNYYRHAMGLCTVSMAVYYINLQWPTLLARGTIFISRTITMRRALAVSRVGWMPSAMGPWCLDAPLPTCLIKGCLDVPPSLCSVLSCSRVTLSCLCGCRAQVSQVVQEADQLRGGYLPPPHQGVATMINHRGVILWYLQPVTQIFYPDLLVLCAPPQCIWACPVPGTPEAGPSECLLQVAWGAPSCTPRAWCHLIVLPFCGLPVIHLCHSCEAEPISSRAVAYPGCPFWLGS